MYFYTFNPIVPSKKKSIGNTTPHQKKPCFSQVEKGYKMEKLIISKKLLQGATIGTINLNLSVQHLQSHLLKEA
jgi:hypothetical protein